MAGHYVAGWKVSAFVQLCSDDEANDAGLKDTVATLEMNFGIFEPLTTYKSHVGSAADGGPPIAGLTKDERRQLYGATEICDLPFCDDSKSEPEFSRVLEGAIAFVCVIDSTKRGYENAEAVYKMLKIRDSQCPRMPICFVFSKVDSPDARHRNLVRSDLEREV